MTTLASIKNPKVKAKFKKYPPTIQKQLLKLRSFVFEVAKSKKVIGPITEELKWNEPAFITQESKSGSTFRIDWKQLFFFFHFGGQDLAKLSTCSFWRNYVN